MKWLLLDDPLEHNGSIHQIISMGLRKYRQEVNVVFGLEEALSLMSSINFDYVIIHHYDTKKVDTLRSRFPSPKYLAKSGLIFSSNDPGSTGEQYNNRLLEHYDLLIPSDDYEFLKKEIDLCT